MVLTSIALLVVSVALIAMSIALAIASHNLYLERTRNRALSEKLNCSQQVSVRKIREPSPHNLVEYDILSGDEVVGRIDIPRDSSRIP